MSDGEASQERVPFEDVVAALLQVDPTGITGQRSKRQEDDPDDDPSEGASKET